MKSRAKKSGTLSPTIDAIVLDDLLSVDGSLLRSGSDSDGELFDRVEFDGRDLTGATFRECEFRGVSIHDTKLRGVTFAECVIADLQAPVFSAPRSSWRDVRIEHSRLGSVEIYEATMRSVQIDGSKLDFVNLRNANLTDVLLTNCIIEELDLSSATVQRLELRDCRIGTLDVSGSRFKDVDLRSSDFSAVLGIEGLKGATIDDAQLSLFAPVFAAHLGVIVE